MKNENKCDCRHVKTANTVTSGIGFTLSIVGLVMLVVLASRKGNAWHVVSCSVYGAALVMAYASFTLYHAFKTHRAEGIFKILDHSAIFVLIAGTYTPFTLVSLRGAWGWSLFGIIWGLALTGIVFKAFFIDRCKIIAPLIYLFMGWLAIIAIDPMLELIPKEGIFLLITGGLFYTMGLLFYAFKQIPFHHAIWHLFVLAGSTCHYFAVLFYVIPPPLPIVKEVLAG